MVPKSKDWCIENNDHNNPIVFFYIQQVDQAMTSSPATATQTEMCDELKKKGIMLDAGLSRFLKWYQEQTNFPRSQNQENFRLPREGPLVSNGKE